MTYDNLINSFPIYGPILFFLYLLINSLSSKGSSILTHYFPSKSSRILSRIDILTKASEILSEEEKEFVNDLATEEIFFKITNIWLSKEDRHVVLEKTKPLRNYIGAKDFARIFPYVIVDSGGVRFKSRYFRIQVILSTIIIGIPSIACYLGLLIHLQNDNPDIIVATSLAIGTLSFMLITAHLTRTLFLASLTNRFLKKG